MYIEKLKPFYLQVQFSRFVNLQVIQTLNSKEMKVLYYLLVTSIWYNLTKLVQIYFGLIKMSHLFGTFLIKSWISLAAATTVGELLYTYSRLRNKHRGTLINLFPEATFLIREGNVYFFQNILYLMVFQGLRLMFLPNVPGATFISGAMFISESRVLGYFLL